MRNEQNLKQTAVIIWSQLMLSIVVYGVVAWFFTKRPNPGQVPPENLLWLLYGFGAVSYVAGLSSQRWLPVGKILGAIIQWAIFDAIGIIGLAVSFLYHDISHVWPFFVLSIYGLIRSYPSDEYLQKFGC